MKNPRSILVTGGSSGIGKALCIEYAAPGVTISFTGRNKERLNETADEIRAKDATANAAILDATDSEGMKTWIDEIDRESPLDLVIANAGIGTDPELAMSDATREVFDTNVYGVFNTIHPALEHMLERRRGQIAVVSSIAGYLGLPFSPAYSSSKAAIRFYGKALRNKYHGKGIEVNVICPGWVMTRLSERHKHRMKFTSSMDDTVRAIRSGLERNKGLIAFPHGIAYIAWLVASLPDAVTDFILRKVRR